MAEATAEAMAAKAVAAATEAAAATKAGATTKRAGATEGAAATAVAWRSSCNKDNAVYHRVIIRRVLTFFV